MATDDDVVANLVALGIKRDLAAKAAAACQGQPAASAVEWITKYLPKEAEKRSGANASSRASTPAASSVRNSPSVPSLRRASNLRSSRASTPAGLQSSSMQGWKPGSRVASIDDKDSLACLSPKDSERSAASTTSSNVVPWLRKTYSKYNFTQKKEEPLAISAGLGTMPHRLMRQSPMSFDVTRSRFRRYGRQVEEFNTRQNEQSMWQIRSPRPKSAMSATAMDEIKNLKHEIDQLRMEIYTRSFPTQASASAQSVAPDVRGRRKAGLLYGGRAYSGDFCD